MRRRVIASIISSTTLAAALAVVTLDSSSPPAEPRRLAASSGDADLTRALDSLLNDPVFDGSQVSLVVRDAKSGDTIYDRNGDQRLMPASNLKLFTSAAALELLGPKHRFTTDVLATGDGPTVRGGLYLRGGGDPTTLAEDYRKLAREVADSGVRRVKGGIRTDAGHFDDIALGEGWSWDYQSEYYSAKTSALTVAPNTDYDPGTIILEPTPGDSAGDDVTVPMTPRTDVVRIKNTATTGKPGSENTLSVERDHGSNVIRVSGSLPADAEAEPEWVTVWDPAEYAGDVFARALERAGVKVSGGVRAANTPDAADRIARDRSMPVGELMTPFMKLSNNMHAEALVKEIGAQVGDSGSWEAGLEEVNGYLNETGVPTDSLRIVDGSGLSRMDNVTTGSVADLLIAVRDEPWFDRWYDALPVAGNPDRFVGGTLSDRMVDTAAADNLHGKTGSLSGASALSGYVTDADGRKLVFSMITNNHLESAEGVEDAVGETLASWSKNDPPAGVQPKTARTDDVPDDVECSWVKAC